MNYYHKYQKYKFKYLNLLNKSGGLITEAEAFKNAKIKIKDINVDPLLKQIELDKEMIKYGYKHNGIKYDYNSTIDVLLYQLNKREEEIKVLEKQINVIKTNEIDKQERKKSINNIIDKISVNIKDIKDQIIFFT